jgi:hypothetical protein
MRARNLRLGVVYHSRTDCYPGRCAAHRPSKGNHMRLWRFEVRLDKYGIMERFCPHGIGHPDPDSIDWAHDVYDERMGSENVEYLAVHGCDGCCYAPA